MRRGKVVKRRYSSVQKAATTIQRAWRGFVVRRRQQCASEDLPKDLKELYGLIRRQHSVRGFCPPTYERFVKLVDRIQAAIEGARVRRRLRSRRLQTIIKEIKEIRVLLLEMSHETANDSSRNLIPQFSAQLQQKLIQLHMALHGPEDAARFLLRRSPATPLVIYRSRATSPNSLNVAKPADSISNKASLQENNSLSNVLSSPNLSTEEGVAKGIEGGINSAEYGRLDSHISFRSFHNKQALDILQKSSLPEKENLILTGTSKNGGCAAESDSASTGLNHKDLKLPNFETAETRQGSEGNCNSEVTEPHVNNVDHGLGFGSSSTNVTIARPLCQISKNLGEKLQDLEVSNQTDMSKRPFLRRKSMGMASQKLDWSKVKPMVSSRLEPELKIKLFKCKSKDGFRTAFMKKKVNYTRIKSRLFNYEKCNLSPQDSITSINSLNMDREGKKDMPGPRNLHIGESGNLRYYSNDTNQVQRCQNNVNHCSETERSENAIHLSKLQTASVVPSQRYNTGPEVAKQWSEITAPETFPRQAVKLRYSKIVKTEDLECHQAGNALDKGTRVHGSARRKYGYSNRYGSSKECPQGFNILLGNKQAGQDVSQSETTNIGHDCKMEVASLEVENAFKEIMALKFRKNMSIHSLFGSFKGTTTIPRLHPESDVFKGSSHEKKRLHDALLQNGRANRLQHDSLTFVSIRD